MTRRQHEMIAKYLADLSKGVLIAALIGVSTGKVHPVFFALDVIGAVLTVWVAYRLEGLINDEV